MASEASPTSATALVSHLRPELFWDADLSRLDGEINAQLIIERVAERGSLQEMQEVWSCYGVDRVRTALQASRSLTDRTIWFFAAVLHAPLTSFRSYRKGVNNIA